MLVEIYINNFVLIDELRLEFSRGLNVLTGETGAGKSIIIDALGLIMGDRVKNDFIRDKSRKAVAEAVFDISRNEEACKFLLEYGLVEKDEKNVIISREIAPSGRSSARINGRNIPVATIKELAAYLLDMHLQHDHFTILRPEMYLSYVDSFAPESSLLLTELGEIFIKLKECKQQIEELKADEQNKIQKLDFLAYQIKEIEKAGLQPGEEEELVSLKKRIKNSQDLMEGAGRLVQLLYEGNNNDSAYDMIAEARDTVLNLQEEEFFASLLPKLEEIYYSLEDISSRVTSFRDSLEFEPGLLDEVEERLYEINRLKSKYGQDINEILAFLEQARQERDVLENSQVQLEDLEKKFESVEKQYYIVANRLSEARKMAGKNLQEKVNGELLQLNMPNIRFEVAFANRTEPAVSGMDIVEFLFSPNPGEPMRPLGRIASGGEISRFILALKTALAEAYHVPTMIFDEIDVGVGGTSLTAMAEKLQELSDSHQVILVTHSPQVASYADAHFLIEKLVTGGNTYTRVKMLDNENRIGELARMLGGENYSDITYKHAREMFNQAQK